MIRTPEQYVESLRDGRKIYLNGEKIEDITKHPQFQGHRRYRLHRLYLQRLDESRRKTPPAYPNFFKAEEYQKIKETLRGIFIQIKKIPV